MAARAVWKGTIVFGTAHVPVKLYSALKDTSIHLHLIDKRKHERVHQKMIDPQTGRAVPHDEIRRAFDTGKGALVMLDEQEIEAAEPEDSRDIRIEEFLAPEKITHQWYERAYWLGPDTGGKAPYFALVAALKKADKEGLARWVMRKKEYVGALRVESDYLMLIELRHAFEVIPASELPAPTGRALQKREVAMAKQLVEAMASDFDITRYHDEYRERLEELIDAKAKGKILKFPKAQRRAAPKSLAAALERSLAAAQKERASA